MQKKFVENLLFILFLNLLIKPFWILGIDVAVQNRVGAEAYGLYYPIFSFSILLNIVLDFGITNYNSRNIAQHGHMLGRYFSGIFNVKVALGIIYMLATLILGYVIGYKGEEFSLLMLLAVNQFLSSMVLYLRSNIAGLHYFKLDGFLSILDRSLMILICSVLLWGDLSIGAFKIQWFVYAQFFAYLIAAFFSFLLVMKHAKSFKFKLDLKMFRIIIRESLPFALLVLLMSFYYRLDSVMIDLLLEDGRVQAGIYAQSYRLLEGFNMFGYLFAGLLLPIFSRMIKSNQSVDGLVNTAFNFVFIPSVAVALLSFLYSNEIMTVLYVAHVDSSAIIFGVLMWSFIAIASTYVYGTLLTANGNLKTLNQISLFGLAINFTLNYFLIPDIGAYGAALATLITQVLVVFLQIISVKKIFKQQTSVSFLLKNLAVLSFGIGLIFLYSSFISDWKIVCLLTMASFGFLMLLFGLIQIKQIKALVSPNND